MIARICVQLIVSAIIMAAGTNTKADTKTMQYGYDANGRLTTSLPDDTNCTIWSYDQNGNRISQQTVTADQTPPLWGQASWGAVSWSAGTSNAIWGSGSWGCIRWTPP